MKTKNLLAEAKRIARHWRKNGLVTINSPVQKSEKEYRNYKTVFFLDKKKKKK